MTATRRLEATTLERLPAPERAALCAELLVGVTHLALDIDGVITAAPRFFCALSKAAREARLRVSIVTSRSPAPEALEATRAELRGLRITFDALYAIAPMGTDASCPHRELDWYQQWLWLKVAYCEREGVQLLVDDDAKVIDLAARFSRKLRTVQVWSG